MWELVRRHPASIFGLALAAGSLAALVANLLEPVYQSSTTLLVDAHRRGFTPAQDDTGSGWTSAPTGLTHLQTQALLLRSRAMAETVAERLDLWTHPELDRRQEDQHRARFHLDLKSLAPYWPFGSQTAPQMNDEEARRAVVDAVAGGIEAGVIPDSEMIRISFAAHDPELAARVAAAYADAYIEAGLETRLETVTRATGWLTRRLEGLRGQVEASELKIQDFRDQQGQVDIDRTLDLTNRELEQLTARLAEARGQREGLRSEYEQIRGLTSLGSAEIGSHPAVIRSPVIQNLKTDEVRAERVVSELGERYGPLHPKLVAAQSDLDSVRSKLREEIDQIIAGAKKRYDVAQARAEQLEAELDRLKARAKDLSRKELTLRSLKRDAEAKRRLYDDLLDRFDAIDRGAKVDFNNALVIDTAQVPKQPIRPRKAPIMAVSVALALLAGVGLAAIRERLDRSLKSAEDLQQHTQLAILGTVPLLDRRARKRTPPERTFLERPESGFAEAIRTVRSGVLLSGSETPRRVMLVTSAVPGDGSTTVAVNLAAALAPLERVLLVDANLRRPSIGAKLGLSADAPGLCNLVAGSAGIDACVHGIEGASLDVLPAGVLVPNPLELLSSGAFAQTLADLEKRYDRIVLDSAPTQAVSDALVLSRLCNAVVLVVRADATPRPLVQLAVERLNQMHTPLIGAVLNQLDRRKAARYGIDGRSPYRRYYFGDEGYVPDVAREPVGAG